MPEARKEQPSNSGSKFSQRSWKAEMAPEESSESSSSQAKRARLDADEGAETWSDHPLRHSIDMTPRRPALNYQWREDMDRQLMESTNPSHDWAIDVAITGSAGVGKTELALQYIKNNSERFEHVLWISSENEDSIKKSFESLAGNLNLVPNQDFNVTVKQVYKTLQNYKCLFVFDNAFDIIQKFLPPFGYDFFVILTSQYTEWAANLLVTVQVFTVEESVKFLESSLGVDEDSHKLAEMLGCLPLALQTAVNFIQHKGQVLQFEICSSYNIARFLRCDYSDEFFKYMTSNKKPFSDLLNLVLEQISKCKRGKFTMKLLKMLSFVSPNNIEIQLFRKDSHKDKKLKINESFLLLKQYSIIFSTENNYCSIAPLMQCIIQKQCNQKEVLSELLSYFNDQLFNHGSYPVPYTHNKYAVQFFNTFGEHLDYVWKHVNKFDDLVKKYCVLFIAGYNRETVEKRLQIIEDQAAIMKRVNIEEMSGFFNVKFPKYKILCMLTMLEGKKYEKVIEAADELSSSTPEECLKWQDSLNALHFQVIALYSLKKYNKAFEISHKVYKTQCDYLGCKNDETLLSLQLMCDIACNFLII